MTARLEPSLFDPDDEIRLAVTPVNAFGVAGSVALRSRTVRVPRPAKAAQEVLRWSASEVRDHLVAEGDRFARDAADAGRVTAKETGTARVRLPAGLFASAVGTPWRVVVDMESRGRVTVALGNANGARGAGPRFDTHGTDTGPVCYVLPFEMPREGKPEASDSYDLVLGCYAPSDFRIASIRVERP